jgi:hypothetical protein
LLPKPVIGSALRDAAAALLDDREMVATSGLG